MKVGYLGRRLASAFVTILLIALINFLLFRAMPGSPERILMRNTPNVTEEMKQAARVRWGLDKPVFPDQLIAYFQSTARGDLGFSFAARGAPVLDVLVGADLADDHPVRPRRAAGDHRRPRPRRVHRLETRRLGRPRRQRRLARALRDAVLPPRHGVPADLRARPPLVPDVRDAHRRRPVQQHLGSRRRLRVAPRAAARGRCHRAHRAVRDHHAILDHRDPVRGIRDDRPGDGAARQLACCATTRCRTPCCRRCR